MIQAQINAPMASFPKTFRFSMVDGVLGSKKQICLMMKNAERVEDSSETKSE